MREGIKKLENVELMRLFHLRSIQMTKTKGECAGGESSPERVLTLQGKTLWKDPYYLYTTSASSMTSMSVFLHRGYS